MPAYYIPQFQYPASKVNHAKEMSRLQDELARTREAFEELVLMVEDKLVRDLKVELKAYSIECRERQRTALPGPNPWHFAEESIRRRESELFDDLRGLLKKCNDILGPESCAIPEVTP